MPKQVDILERQVKDAVSKGATLLVGGKRIPNKKGNWFEPTVLVNVNHSMGMQLIHCIVLTFRRGYERGIVRPNHWNYGSKR